MKLTESPETPKSFRMIFSGAWIGNAISGSATVSKTMGTTSTSGDTVNPLSTTIPKITLSKQ